MEPCWSGGMPSLSLSWPSDMSCSSCLPEKMEPCWSGGMPSSSWPLDTAPRLESLGASRLSFPALAS
eukprot:9156930-Prorocentrum_lima.AAC.1